MNSSPTNDGNEEAEVYRQRLTAIVEDSDDAIISKDLNGIITSWNRAAEKLFGYTAGEVVGQSITILIPEDRANEEPQILARIRQGQRIDHYETKRRKKDGSFVDISLTVSPVKDGRGNVVGASKIARDISERLRAHQQAAMLHAEMQHRVKNLLAVIEGLARFSRPRNEPVVDRFLDAFMPRLRALLSVGEIVLESRDRLSDLRRVAEKALEPFLAPALAPLRRKEKGGKPVVAEPIEESNVIDLMEALKKSLGQKSTRVSANSNKRTRRAR